MVDSRNFLSGDFDVLERLISETAKVRMSKHRNVPSGQMLIGEKIATVPKAENISAIMLWGNIGKIVLKAHFETETAQAWAAVGLGRAKELVASDIAIDFMREFSNLHAGAIRGMFETVGFLFGVSLPFVVSGDSERVFNLQRLSTTMTGGWILTCGEESISCTYEFDLYDRSALREVLPKLEGAITAEEKDDGAQDGDIEFIL